MDKKRVTRTILALIFVALLGAGAFVMFDATFLAAGDPSVIETSGRIAATEFQAASRLPGKVEEVLVHEGQEVEKGQLLARLESRQVRSQVDAAAEEVNLWTNRLRQAELGLEQVEIQSDSEVEVAEARLQANLSSLEMAAQVHAQAAARRKLAQARLQEARIAREQALLNLDRARADYNLKEKDYRRFSILYREEAVPGQQFDQVKAACEVAFAEVSLARREVDRTAAAIEIATRELEMQGASERESLAGIRQGEAQVGVGESGVKASQAGRLDVQKASEEVRNARAMLDRTRAMLQSAQADYEDTKVCAPISGIVSRRVMEPGEVAAAGTPIVTLISLHDVYLRLFLPTDQAGRIQIGAPVDITADAFSGEVFKGRVQMVSSTAEFTPKNVETREQRAKLVFEVKAAVENRGHKLKPGMPAGARIHLAPSR